MINRDEMNGVDLHTKEIRAIAIMEGCFPQKFGVPRQAGIAQTAQGRIRFLPPFDHENFIQGLELSSHIWLIFGFHQNNWNGKATVRPQRLGGNERMGVFATRSSFRPNGLGLSAVKIDKIHLEMGLLEVSGHDLVDGTPIYDIKPYIPFADALPEAINHFATTVPHIYPVSFSDSVMPQLQLISEEYPQFQHLITEVIGQNPTPQFHDDAMRIYGVALGKWDILFQKIFMQDDIPDRNQVLAGEISGEISAEGINTAQRNVNSHQKNDGNVKKQKLIGFTVTEIKVRGVEIGDT